MPNHPKEVQEKIDYLLDQDTYGINVFQLNGVAKMNSYESLMPSQVALIEEYYRNAKSYMDALAEQNKRLS